MSIEFCRIKLQSDYKNQQRKNNREIKVSGQFVHRLFSLYIGFFSSLPRVSSGQIVHSFPKDLLFLDRLVGCAYILHSLRKFADVIEIVVDFDVIRVDKPANTLFRQYH